MVRTIGARSAGEIAHSLTLTGLQQRKPHRSSRCISSFARAPFQTLLNGRIEMLQSSENMDKIKEKAWWKDMREMYFTPGDA